MQGGHEALPCTGGHAAGVNRKVCKQAYRVKRACVEHEWLMCAHLLLLLLLIVHAVLLLHLRRHAALVVVVHPWLTVLLLLVVVTLCRTWQAMRRSEWQ